MKASSRFLIAATASVVNNKRHNASITTTVSQSRCHREALLGFVPQTKLQTPQVQA